MTWSGCQPSLSAKDSCARAPRQATVAIQKKNKRPNGITVEATLARQALPETKNPIAIPVAGARILCYPRVMSEEVVLFKGTPSLMLKAGTFAVGILLIGGFIAGAVLAQQPLIAIGVGVVLIYLIGVAALIRTQSFEITSERIRWRRGILTKRTDELELYRVMDVTLIEPFLLRMVGAGNIEINAADATTPRLSLPAVKGAKELREQLRVSIENVRARKGVRLTEFDRGDEPGA